MSHYLYDAHVCILRNFAAELVFRAANDLSIFGKIAYKTLQTVQEAQVFDGNTLYSVLHEPIYCQG